MARMTVAHSPSVQPVSGRSVFCVNHTVRIKMLSVQCVDQSGQVTAHNTHKDVTI